MTIRNVQVVLTEMQVGVVRSALELELQRVRRSRVHSVAERAAHIVEIQESLDALDRLVVVDEASNSQKEAGINANLSRTQTPMANKSEKDQGRSDSITRPETKDDQAEAELRKIISDTVADVLPKVLTIQQFRAFCNQLVDRIVEWSNG